MRLPLLDWCVHNMSGSGGERFSTLFRSIGKREAFRKRKKTATSISPLASSDVIFALTGLHLGYVDWHDTHKQTENWRVILARV